MIFTKGMRILVIAAHPDDEVLGCGGTLAAAITAGAEVAVKFLGEGVSARFPLGEYHSDEFLHQTKVRMEGARKGRCVLWVFMTITSEKDCVVSLIAIRLFLS